MKKEGVKLMKQRRVVLKDIADRVGLTVNTVSRALKNKEDISLATRQEIQRIAIEMGYIPDAVASSLRSGSTKVIGIMYDNIANPYFMIMIEILHQKLHDVGYEVMIFTSFGDRSKLNVEVFNLMAARRLDGIITFLKPNRDVVHLAKKNGIPMVILGREGEDIGVDSVYTNDVQGGSIMGEYLYKNGHRNVGYIGVPNDILCSVQRAQGLVDYYQKQGIDIPEDHIRYMEHFEDSLRQQIDYLIARGVTAIFCFNDSMAYESMAYIKQVYPDKNIEVTGYDYIGERLIIPVGLTTIGTNKRAMIDDAVYVLLRRMKEPDAEVITKVHETFLVKI